MAHFFEDIPYDVYVRPADIARRWVDVTYADRTPYEKLDIYLPDEGDGPFPVIIDVHGGGWYLGDKGAGFLGRVLRALRRGYAVVSFSYTLTKVGPVWPLPVQELKAAVRFLRAHSKEYSLDPDAIGAWGESAGAHIVMLAGLTGPLGSLDDPALGGNPGRSPCLQAVCEYYGPTDLSMMDTYLAECSDRPGLPSSGPGAPATLLFGADMDRVPEKVGEADPMNYITDRAPPFAVRHGTNDDLVPFQQGVLFAEALKKAIGPEKVDARYYDGYYHADARLYDGAIFDGVIAFFDRYLKK